MGSPAAQVLGKTGWGMVHSVFARAINLKVGRYLLTIAQPDLQNLPYGLLCDLRQLNSDHQVKSGERVRVTGHELWFLRTGARIDYSEAVIWSPHLRLPIGDHACLGIQTRMDIVRKLACERDMEAGLTPLLAQVKGILLEDPAIHKGRAGYQRRAGEALVLLVRAVRGYQTDRMVSAGSGLLGLGIGLTPSGDDVLTGLLTTLIVTGQDAIHLMAVHASQHLARMAEDRTTIISAHLLRQAGQGYVTERYRNLLASLVLGEEASLLGDRTQQMMAYGATSGAEVILGSLLGLALSMEWEAKDQTDFFFCKEAMKSDANWNPG